MSTQKDTPVAVITGGSEGIGFELARLCAQDNFDLVLVAQNSEKLQIAAKRIQAQYPKCTVLTFAQDLSEISAAQAVYKFVRKHYRQTALLINNAGFGVSGRIDTVDPELQSQEILVNVHALTTLTQLFVKDMVREKSGKVLNVASTAAFLPGPLMAAYYASKAYVLSFSEALWFELRTTGVSVTTLCPGPTKTGFGARSHMQRSLLFQGSLMQPSVVAAVGYRAMMRRQRVVVSGFLNSGIALMLRITPHILLMHIIFQMHKSRS